MVYKNALAGEQGWSLLELVLCLGIVMSLCAAAVPRAVNMDKMHVKYETLYLLNTIRFVQTWSYGLDYCAFDNHYSSQERPVLYFWANGNYYIMSQGQRRYPREPEHGVSVRSNERKVKFNARGYSTACTVRISRGNYVEKIIIDTVGRVRVEEG
ncbi:MAG: hypothetical protein PHQ44_02225 [Anaerovibrio sp.]|nr:hypothetical protein [Anaerovibrio sp.]